ncbi:MAG: outer membrane beta-barrel protein [Emcibacteraceae bacterium]|nr:outer membrane beta-barrel protein [Emcibacteraceae bacterium]
MPKDLIINKISNRLSLLLMTTALTVSAANAQTTGNADDAAVVTYDAGYFIQYAPVTLLDMLQRVPGVQEILNKNRQQRGGRGGANNRGERGFGSGGDQILIDGKRLAGKSNNIDDTLGRISADQVDRVELIRGAAGGLDVQSQGLVINIILKEGSSNSTTFWQFKSETKQGHKPGFEGLFSHSGSTGNLDYSISGERTANNGFTTRYETIFDETDLNTGDKLIDRESHERGWKANTNLVYNFEEGSVLRLNGLYETKKQTDQEDRIETGLDPENLLWDKAEEGDSWEFGGDFTADVGVLGRFKALFVINKSVEDEYVERFQDVDATPFIYTQEDEHETKKEKIFRASFTNSLSDKQSLEVGAEAAINTFDKNFNSLDRELATDVFEIEAEDNVEIQENRYEIFANHTYNFSSKIVLQSSFTTEFSNIVADNIFANGDVDTRDTNFTYFKPRVNLRYDVTDKDQLRFTVEKKVSQLDFNNFVTRYDQRTEEFKFGNTQIRPEQLWEFLAAYEHRFPNDGGSFEVEAFYRSFKDKITRVDFTQYYDFSFAELSNSTEFFALSPTQALRDYVDDTGDSYTSKSGNIESAKSYGANVKASVRLGFMGVPNAVLSANYTYEKSNLIDQFTFLDRRFERQSKHRTNVNFRHDMTDIGLSYGARASFTSDAATQDVGYFWPYSPQPNFSVFAEYNIMPNVKLRADFKQLSGRRGLSTQYLYSDHRNFNDLYEYIDKDTRTPREMEITLSGTF